jgi:lipoate-protein ligase A
MMSRVLKVPDEKFRDKVHKTLRDNLSTIRRELGEKQAGQWDEARLNALMAEEFQKLLGPMEPCERDQKLQKKMDDLRAQMLTDDWLLQKGRRRVSGRDIKVRAGTKVLNRVHKAPGGLIRADFEVKEGSFGEISISGDFFCFPEDAIEGLEAKLEGKPIQKAQKLLSDFYAEGNIETPGIEIDDWIKVLVPQNQS